MRKTHFPWILAGILVVSFAAFGALGLTLAALGCGGAYLVSLRLHPRIRHTGFRGCGGTGEHRGAVFTWVFRRCPGCQSGRLIRWGAGRWGAEHIQAEYERGRAARAAARSDHTWR